MYHFAISIGMILAVCFGLQQSVSAQADPFATNTDVEPDPFASSSEAAIADIERDPFASSNEVKEGPRTLTAVRKPEFIGKSFNFRITGTSAGTIYGTDVYTDDSYLSTAAVHAGIVKPGHSAVVRVTILPGRNSYRSMELNGITSRSYGSWSGSYLIDSSDKSDQLISPAVKQPGSMSGIVGEIGQSFEYEVTGSLKGFVWGADVYTDDSAIAAAAVHAGAVTAGETSMVKVTLLPGRSFYNGSERNGVKTRSYGSYRRSYMIDRATKPRAEDPFALRTP